jgi:FkbM family methyltransferase
MSIGLKHRLLRKIARQHWIPRGRDLVIRGLCNPDCDDSVEFETNFFGMRYRGNFNNFIDWSVYFYGAYAANELQALRDISTVLRQSGAGSVDFFDVGANIGHHSLFMSMHADKVFAFEPFHAVRRKLARRIADNEIRNLTVFPVGLGDADRELTYYEPTGVNMGTGSFVGAIDNGSGRTATLPVRAGDTFFDRNELPPIDILKIDVEGFESRVIWGLANRLRRDRPVVLMEMSDRTRHSFGTEAAFRSSLYDDHEIVELGSASITGPYKFGRFDFTRGTEIVVFPSERRSALGARLGF